MSVRFEISERAVEMNNNGFWELNEIKGRF